MRKIEFQLKNEPIACCTTIDTLHPANAVHIHTLHGKKRQHHNSISLASPRSPNLLLRQNKNVIYYVFYCHYAQTHRGAGPMEWIADCIYKLPLVCVP